MSLRQTVADWADGLRGAARAEGPARVRPARRPALCQRQPPHRQASQVAEQPTHCPDADPRNRFVQATHSTRSTKISSTAPSSSRATASSQSATTGLSAARPVRPAPPTLTPPPLPRSYTPGFDTHGLPLELKALSALKKPAGSLTPQQIRAAARTEAEKGVAVQTQEFRAFASLGAWGAGESYKTMEWKYERRQLEVVREMVRKGAWRTRNRGLVGGLRREVRWRGGVLNPCFCAQA